MTQVAPIKVPIQIAEPEQIELIIAHRNIAAGRRGNPLRCPAALALQEAGYEDISVGTGIAFVGTKAYSGGEPFTDWINAFDFDGDGAPERFLLQRTPEHDRE